MTAPDVPPAPASARRRLLRRLLVLAAVLGVVGFGVHWYLDVGYRYFHPRNWGVVEEGRVYRSGLNWGGLVEDLLRDHHIATIVDLGELDESDSNVAAERAAARRMGVRVVLLPGLEGDGTGEFERYAVAVAEMARAEPGKAVLVHCVAGSERTGVAVALYRMLVQGVDGTTAWEEYLRYRRKPPKDASLAGYVNERMPELARRLVADGVIPRVPEPFPAFGPAAAE